MKQRILVIVFLFSLSLKAQPPRNFFTKLGGAGEDIGYSAKQTLDGQYIIAGSSSSYGTNGNTDVYLAKMDSMGFLMWQKFYGGTQNEVGKSVIQLSDSGYVIVGFTSSFGAGGYDAYIIRVDKNGQQLWQQTFGGTDWDFANDVVLGPDGNLFVVGNTSSFGSGLKDGFVLKYDLFGNLLLQNFYGGAEDDELNSIITTNDYNLATVGYTQSRGEINGDGYFLKLDLNGDTLFTITFGGPYKDYACDLVQKDSTQNRDYYISGARTFSAGAKSHAYMYLISTNGTFISDDNEFRNADDESFISVANSKHHSYLTAFARSTTVGNKSMQEEIFVAYITGYAYLVNDAGDLGHEYVYSVEATNDKGYITVGSTDSYGSIGKDIFFVKRDSTVINYESVMGIPEVISSQNGPVIRCVNQALLIDFNAEKIRQIEIIDLLGQIQYAVRTADGHVKIDVSAYASSAYILRITDENGAVYCRKFVK